RRYVALSNIAAAYQGLAQYDRAMEFYERFLREAPADATDRPRVEASIAALEDLLGTVVVGVTGTASAEIWVDNRRLGTAPGRLRVPGGRHVIELRAPGFLPSRRETQLSAHDTVTVNLAMERAGRGLSPVVFGVGAGATVVSGVVSAVFGVLAFGARDDVNQRLGDPVQRFTVTQADRDHVAQLAILSDAFTITAGVMAAGTIVVAVLTDWHGRPPERSPTRALRPRWSPMAGPTATGIQIQGTF
ncbi:MAG: PEGA domain-containing protein, partial [Deltaproteobacteria bacterium]